MAAIKLIAPISHALDRTSHLRILPRHITDVYCLPSPILNHCKSGEVVVHLSGKAFSSVAFVESHEMLINKDIKAAIRRIESDYIQHICAYLTIHAKVIKTLKSQTNLNRARTVNPNIMHVPKQHVNFEPNVKAIDSIVNDVNLLPSTITVNRGLCNVFTNQVATLQVRDEMINFVSIGEREMDAFVNSRILNIFSLDFPVSRKQLETFQPPSKKQNKSKSCTAEEDHKTFLKMSKEKNRE